MKEHISQLDLLKEYFIRHPNRDIAHPEIVDWAAREYLERTGKVFRDPDRGIRLLAQKGFLIKVGKGIYRYDPEYLHHRELEPFTEAQKKQVMERDGYRCALCGRSERDDVELHVDHIKSRGSGGKADINNAQILCAEYNILKKHYNQTETGKRMFIRLYEKSKEIGDMKIFNCLH